MIIAFTGTRAGLTPAQRHCLAQQLSLLDPVAVHHGDCIGADTEFNDLCRPRGCIIHLHPANIDRFRAWCSFTPPTVLHRSLSPLKRNHVIVAASELLLAAPSSPREILRSGTWAAIRHARKLGKAIILIFPDGSVITEP